MNVQNLIYQVSHDSYIQKLLRYMDDIEYRRVSSDEDLKDIEKLRSISYCNAKIYSDLNRKMIDTFDLDSEVFLFGVYYRSQLVSTVRIHILNKLNRHSNSRTYFSHLLDPLLDQGVSFMDPTRFAVDPIMEEEISGLPLITLRLGFLAAKHSDCDFCLSMIKEGHGGFYRRVFQASQVTPFTAFDAFTAKYALFTSPKSMEEVICNRYPIFRSLRKEREMLFDKPKFGQPANLSVKPTARVASQLHNQIKYDVAAS